MSGQTAEINNVPLVRASLRSRRDLAIENLLLRHQLAVLTRPTRKRPAIRRRDRLVWILARRLCHGWRRHLVLVRPATVVAWHRRGWRLFWWWRSRCGELLKLGIAVSRRSIRRFRARREPRPPTQTWRTFLPNHRPHVWAADLFTVQTLAFKTLDVLVFVSHHRREVMHVNVTSSPTAAWIGRQLVQATPWGRAPRFLVRDRDRVYGADFVARATGLGIETVVTPVRAPRANAVAERLIGTLRRECLDHLVVVNEQHLRAVLAQFVTYNNGARSHRALALDTPHPATRPRHGPILARPVLGGLHHAYERAA